MDTLNRFILSENYRDYLELIKGLRNGAIYGCKIRFPHAVVMTFLFRSGSLMDKIQTILTATYQHSKNLACFVFLYKLILLIQKKLSGKESHFHHLIGGAVGGYFIFGTQNNVNHQIVLYLLSRVITSICYQIFTQLKETQASLESNSRALSYISDHAFSYQSAIVWGLVMWIFRYYPNSLQASLSASMTYLYLDSQKWDSLNTLLLFNK